MRTWPTTIVLRLMNSGGLLNAFGFINYRGNWFIVHPEGLEWAGLRR